jgi:hypothetical protein
MNWGFIPVERSHHNFILMHPDSSRLGVWCKRFTATAVLIDRHSSDPSWLSAPEICVEVLSPANTPDEIDQKRELYF